MNAMTRLLCKLGWHRWRPIAGLAPWGYINRECIHCKSRKFHKLGHDYEQQWVRWERDYEARERYFKSGGRDE